LLRGQPVAGMRTGTGGWRVHLATDDCDATVRAVVAAGGTITEEPAVFGFTLDGNPNVDFDFTFLRLPDGHEVGGIMGLPGAPSGWNTTFEVTDTDTTLVKAGATVTPDDTIYGRSATFHDPFGVELTIIARP
jgi:predicted enzyme related to lactoylglutathione lyase